MAEIEQMIEALEKSFSCSFNGVKLVEVASVLKKYKELEDENARLRQQRDAANAQLDFLMDNKKELFKIKIPGSTDPERAECCNHEFVYSHLGWKHGFRCGYVCRFCGEHQRK